MINSGADAAGLQLTSVYNSPNCVTENLNSRDYEIINFIIARASKSIRSYYLGEGVTPAQLCEIIQWLNDESNAKVLGNKITSVDVHDISKSDYDEIMEFELKNLIL